MNYFVKKETDRLLHGQHRFPAYVAAIAVSAVTLTSCDYEPVDNDFWRGRPYKGAFEMVKVDGGTFTMGATAEQGSNAFDDEKPVHQVTLSSFYIGKYEVTQEEWESVMGRHLSYFKGANLPVERVTWNMIVGTNGNVGYTVNGVNYCTDGFCYKLSQKKGGGVKYRLPTEAEWEYAARGGRKSKGYKYSGSDTIGDVAWFGYLYPGGNADSTTHPVGTKMPNELGIYDMSGNVWEWCSDWYSTYSSSSITNPVGSTSGSARVYRGSWSDDAYCCRVSYRRRNNPLLTAGNYGFRLAK